MNKKLIYGCMGWGGSWNADPISSGDIETAEQAFEAALDAGIVHFDHADIYTFGKAEEVFGILLQRHDRLRERIFIQSKTGILLNSGPGGSNTYKLSKAYLLEQVQKSIDRLGCQYLDAYLLHRPDPLMDPAEVADAFAEMKDKGWVRQFGVSNFSVSLLQSLAQHWREPLFCNQIQYSLEHAEGLNAMATGLDHYQYSVTYNRPGFEIQAWGALDRGLYTEGPLEAHSSKQAETAHLVRSLAEKYQTNTYAIILSWLAACPGNIIPVIGTSNPERIRNCAEMSTISLSREDWYQLWITQRGEKLP